MGLLSPDFLVSNIRIIGQIIAVMFLVIFDDYISGRIIFPWVDKLRDYLFEKTKEKFKRKKYRAIPNFLAKCLATILFILYFFLGYWYLAEYVVIPILQRLQHIILIVIVVFFLTMVWVFNNKRMRRKYFYD